MSAKRSKPAAAVSAFISHAKADAKKAQAIAEGLESRGFKCWIAPRDVKAGRTYGDEIIRGIESAKAFILVLSKASNESDFVAREVERAVSKKKPVLAVRIANVEPGPALELFVSSTQWIDAFLGKLAPHIDRLAERLAEEEDIEPAAPKGEVRQPRKLPRWAIPVVAASLLLVVGAVLFLRNSGDPNLAQKSDPDYQACETATGTNAIAACDRAIYSGKFSGPGLAYLYNDRGFLHMMSGDLDRGRADFDRAIQLDPNNYYPYWNRAEILRHRGDVDSAMADYQKALTLKPKEDDKLKIEASLSALAAKPKDRDRFLITDPSGWSEPEASATATSPAYPAEPPPDYSTLEPVPAAPPPFPGR